MEQPESKHTVGPWRAEPVDAKETYFLDVNILSGDGSALAVALHNVEINPEEVEANARLIAAAPDLLKALEDMSCAFARVYRFGRDALVELGGEITQEVDEANECLINFACAAIAKATGKTTP